VIVIFFVLFGESLLLIVESLFGIIMLEEFFSYVYAFLFNGLLSTISLTPFDVLKALILL